MFFEQLCDLEQIKIKAKQEKLCPYYLSKQTVQDAEIICLPYISLFDTKMRTNLDLNIENSIILIDEAHNLL